MAIKLLSIAAYARHRGCDEKAVRKAINENRISAVMVGTRKMIDPAVADIQWAQNTRARADSGRSAAQSGEAGGGMASLAQNAPAALNSNQTAASLEPSYSDYRTRREKAEAEQSERANLREAGMLVGRTGVERGIHDVVHAMRDAVMATGPRAAPKCIGMTDARDIEQVITSEVRRALEGFEARLLEKLPPKEAYG